MPVTSTRAKTCAICHLRDFEILCDASRCRCQLIIASLRGQTKWLDGEGEHEGKGLRTSVVDINSRFSAMFVEIGLAGEITLDEAKIGNKDDFENYSLKIMVKFR